MAATKLKTFDRDELLGHNAGSQQIIPNTTTINGVALTDYAFDNVGIKDLRIQLKYHQGDNIFTGHMKIYSTDRFNGKDVRQKPGALDIAMQIDPSTGVIVGCSTRGVESLKTALGLTEGKKEVTGTGGLTGTGTCPPDTVVTGFSASSVICTALAGKGILKEDKTTLVAGK
jgi:hypothetical protein